MAQDQEWIPVGENAGENDASTETQAVPARLTRREFVVSRFRLTSSTTVGPIANSNDRRAEYKWFGLKSSKDEKNSPNWLIIIKDGHPYVEKWTGPLDVNDDTGARICGGWQYTSKAFSLLVYIALFPHYPPELSPELLK